MAVIILITLKDIEPSKFLCGAIELLYEAVNLLRGTVSTLREAVELLLEAANSRRGAANIISDIAACLHDSIRFDLNTDN